MLRLAVATPDPQAASPRVLGIDDFAIRRGQHSGTLLIDCETGALVECDVPGGPGAARSASRRYVPDARPCSAAAPLTAPQMHGIHEIFCGFPGASECPYEQRSGLLL